MFSAEHNTNPRVGEKVPSCLRRHMEICQAISPAYDGEEYTINPYKNIFGMRSLMTFSKEKCGVCDEEHFCSRYICREPRNAFMAHLPMFFMTLPKRQRFSNKSVAFPFKAGDHLGMRNGLGMEPLEKLFEKLDGVVSRISVQVLRMEVISSELWTLMISDSFHCMWIVAFRNKSLESLINKDGLEGFIFLLMDMEVVMKRLRTGQRVVALKNIEAASYPEEFDNAFSISFEGHPYTIGNPTLIFPESMDNYSLYRSVFSHTVTAVFTVLDWELVKLGSQTMEPFSAYLVRVCDKQSTMKVMCAQSKWEKMLAKWQLQPGGQIATTLHQLLKSSKDVEKLIKSYDGIRDEHHLRGIYPGFEHPVHTSSKRLKKKAKYSKALKAKEQLLKESFVCMRLNRDVRKGNVPNFRVMIMIGELIYLGSGGGVIQASLPFHRGDEAVNLEGMFLVANKDAKDTVSGPFDMKGELRAVELLDEEDELVYKHGVFTPKSLVDIFNGRDTVASLLAYLDTETVVDMLNVCKNMTAYFVETAGVKLHHNDSGTLQYLFPLAPSVYQILNKHLIEQCMAVAVDRRVLYNSRSGIKYEESIGSLFFEGIDMPDGSEKMYPPSAPLEIGDGSDSDGDTVVYTMYTTNGEETANIFTKESAADNEEDYDNISLYKHNKQFTMDIIDMTNISYTKQFCGAREYFVRNMNVMPLVPGTFEVIAQRAKLFCEKLWSLSVDSSQSGLSVEYVNETNYPSLKFENVCVRVNVQMLREWVSYNQVVYMRYVEKVDGTSITNYYYERDGWNSMKVSDGKNCMDITTMCPTLTTILSKLDIMSEKRELDMIKGVVLSMNIWIPNSRTSIMRNNGKRSWLAFNIEATDFELIETNRVIMATGGRFSTLPSIFTYPDTYTDEDESAYEDVMEEI